MSNALFGSTRLRGRTLLLTDDDNLIRTVYADALRAAGVRVVEAHGGVECLSLVAGVRPDLVLLDLYMPGPDGWATLARLRADAAMDATPVFAMSGDVTAATRQRALEAHFDAFLEKPLSAAALIATLERVYGAWESNPTARSAAPSAPVG